MSAAAVATLYNAGEYESPIAKRCLAYVVEQLGKGQPFNANEGSGHSFYMNLYAAQAFYQAGDKYWDSYFPRARDALLREQKPDGSWARRRRRPRVRNVDRADRVAAALQVPSGVPEMRKRMIAEIDGTVAHARTTPTPNCVAQFGDPRQAAWADRDAGSSSARQDRAPGRGDDFQGRPGPTAGAARSAIGNDAGTCQFQWTGERLQDLTHYEGSSRERNADRRRRRRRRGDAGQASRSVRARPRPDREGGRRAAGDGRAHADRLLAGGHVLLEGVPGLAKTLLVETLAQLALADVRAHPVHAGPDARGHHRHRGHRRRPDDAAAELPLRARPGVRATSCSPTRSTARRRRRRRRCSRRCRSARSPSAARRHRCRRAVLRARDAEPDRAGGHLSAARGAARSLPAQDLHRLPEPRDRARGLSPERRGDA